MKDFVIISDGACDLFDYEVKNLDVRVIPFYIAFEEGKYLKETVDVQVDEFYQKLIDHPNVFPKTSMPTSEDYYKEFAKAYNEGLDVICVTISKKFSGSLNSALTAKKLLTDEHPEARIEVVDSTVLSLVQGLLVREIVRMKRNGLSLDEVISNVEYIKETARCYFTVDGLSYLQHGGRIGKLAAIVGNFLKVNPLIVQKDGEIHSGGIAISRKRATMKILDKFKSTFEKHNLNLDDYLIQIGYGYSKADGEELVQRFEATFNRKVELLGQIGATIAVHTGPYPLGVAFIRKYDAKRLLN